MSTERSPHLTGFDPASPASLVDPYPDYARARREAPVFFEPGLGWWFVSRYDDVLAVIMDPQRFGSGAQFGRLVPEEVADRLPDGLPWSYPSLLNNDPPGHTRVRRLCSRAFRQSAIAALEPQLVALADDLIDGFAAQGRADLVSSFAGLFPMIAIARIVGVPEEDVDQFLGWSRDLLALQTPVPDETARIDVWERAADFSEYCAAFADGWRTARPESVLADLMDATVDGEPALMRPELISILSQLIVGGHETVSYMIGNVMLRLLQDPEALAHVHAEPDLIANAVEESLRQMGPVLGLFRVALDDVELGGASIRRGDVLIVLFSSASHDEAHFTDPERFDIHRSDVGAHLGFGKGIHFCLGAPLARLEGGIAVDRLLTRLPGLHLPAGGSIEYTTTLLHHGLTRLDVEWSARTPG